MMIARFGWVAADSAYGRDSKFRAFFEGHRMSYVVELPVEQTVTDIDGRRGDILVKMTECSALQ